MEKRVQVVYQNVDKHGMGRPFVVQIDGDEYIMCYIGEDLYGAEFKAGSPSVQAWSVSSMTDQVDIDARADAWRLASIVFDSLQRESLYRLEFQANPDKGGVMRRYVWYRWALNPECAMERMLEEFAQRPITQDDLLLCMRDIQDAASRARWEPVK